MGKIEHSPLGALHWFFRILIIFYVVVIKLAMNGGYLSKEVPTNTVVFNIQQPIGSCSPTGGAVCFDDFNNQSELAYCQRHSCRYLDEFSAGIMYQSSVMVATLM